MKRKAPSKSQKRTAAQVGRLSRRKGKTFERLVAADLRAIYGQRVKRGWQTRAGSDAPDVENVPFWLECKHHRRVNIQQALAQAQAAAVIAKSPLPPLIVAKDDGGQPVAVMAWVTILELLGELESLRGETGVKAAPPTLQTVSVPVFEPAQPRAA